MGIILLIQSSYEGKGPYHLRDNEVSVLND